MIYYGSALSPNLTETSEGYLIALNVPISRTGMQKYLPSEVPIENIEKYIGPDGKVPVYREPEEVFSPLAIASFEGKPATDGHPDGNMVDNSNESFYRKGHMQNVRRGSGDFADNLVADIFITDPLLIDAVKRNTKREVSCGYNFEAVEENGKIYQRNIRGNHIAVVPRGRAGSDVAIHDNAPPSAGERSKHMAKDSKTLFQHIFGTGLKEFAKDADPEELAEAAKLGEMKPEKDEAPDGGIAEVLAAVKALGERLDALEKSDKEVHKEIPGDALDELEGEIAKEAKKEDEPAKQEEAEKSAAIGDDCMGTPTGDSDAREFVKRMKPIVAKMPIGAARDAAAKELLDIYKGGKKTPYGDVQKAVLSHKAADAANQGQTIAQKTNAFAENCKALRDKANKEVK